VIGKRKVNECVKGREGREKKGKRNLFGPLQEKRQEKHPSDYNGQSNKERKQKQLKDRRGVNRWRQNDVLNFFEERSTLGDKRS